VTDSEPLSFWRENKFRFPAIAALARDVLAIPATGAGVERLFNTARDICHYRRGSLKSHTIEELMLYLCTSRFDLEVQEQKEFEQFFGSDEIQILVEEKDKKPEDVEVDAISDTEEQGDRPSSRDLIDVDDDEDDATLQPLNTQLRTSRRKRRHVEDELYEHY
jgi:hypothetical protein